MCGGDPHCGWEYLVRNHTLGPPLENNPEIPPSSRDEGLRLLHGLENSTDCVVLGVAN